MKVVHCPCGKNVEGETDDALVENVEAHFAADHPDLVGTRQETPVFSTLRNINPTIDIFRRDGPRERLPEAVDRDRQRRDPARP